MEHTNEYQDVIKGKPKAVNVEGIERELIQLWKSAAEAAREKGQPTITRACSLNVVIYLSSARPAENVDDLITQLILQHPSRAIVITADDKAIEPNLEAWISALCKLPTPEGKQVCCEQVVLRAKGEAINELLSTVASLLVPDLPVFLWWRGDPPFESEIFSRLIATSDRVLLDSSTFQNPEAELFKLVKFVKDQYDQAAFSDLNWTRLTPWRELTAQFFDAPNFRPYLSRINEMIIEYRVDDNRARPNPVQALLMAGWLASRLRWKPEPYAYRVIGHNRVLNMSEGGRKIVIEIRAVTSQVSIPGGLVSLKLMEEGNTHAQFSISKTEDPMCAETNIKVTGMNPIQRVVCMEEVSEVELVGKELEILNHDLTYEEALEVGDFTTPLVSNAH